MITFYICVNKMCYIYMQYVDYFHCRHRQIKYYGVPVFRNDKMHLYLLIVNTIQPVDNAIVRHITRIDNKTHPRTFNVSPNNYYCVPTVTILPT